MAILLDGKSRCPLCGQVIGPLSEATATPPFLKATHPLARFSDAVFHRRCFEECPDREQVERLLARFREIMANAPKNPTLAEYEAWLSNVMHEFE